MRVLATSCSALLLAALAVGPAEAQTERGPNYSPPKYERLSAAEKAKLQELSPELRQRVMERMEPEQTVTGILETMLLNKVASRVEQPRQVRFLHNERTVMVVDAAGQSHRFQYDPRTWDLAR